MGVDFRAWNKIPIWCNQAREAANFAKRVLLGCSCDSHCFDRARDIAALEHRTGRNETVLNETARYGAEFSDVARAFRSVSSQNKRYCIEPNFFNAYCTLYWLPKLHKSTRFIAASNKCTTKPLSSLLTDCLTSVLIQNIVVILLGTLVVIASGLLTMLSLFYIILTTPRRQEVWKHLISPRFILELPFG